MKDVFDSDRIDIDNRAIASKPAAPAAAPPTADTQLVDPFDLYLQREQAGDVFFDGDFIYFNGQTGAWTRNKKLIPATVSCLCNMRGIVLGWVKVDGNNKVTDRSQLGFLINGYQPLDRDQLDDLDERNWPYNHGKREDPWRKTIYLPMRMEGENVVFGPFAETQRKAIRSFIAAYRRDRVSGKYPVVLLENRSFPNQSGGTTFVPTFKIIGWEYWDGAPAPEVPPVAVPVTPPAAAKPVKPALAKPRTPNDDMDDDIPF